MGTDFPELNVAIEHDGHDPTNRNVNQKMKLLENKLDCKFILYNPDAKDFTIERLVNKIFFISETYLMLSSETSTILQQNIYP